MIGKNQDRGILVDPELLHLVKCAVQDIEASLCLARHVRGLLEPVTVLIKIVRVVRAHEMIELHVFFALGLREGIDSEIKSDLIDLVAKGGDVLRDHRAVVHVIGVKPEKRLHRKRRVPVEGKPLHAPTDLGKVHADAVGGKVLDLPVKGLAAP